MELGHLNFASPFRLERAIFLMNHDGKYIMDSPSPYEKLVG